MASTAITPHMSVQTSVCIPEATEVSTEVSILNLERNVSNVSELSASDMASENAMENNYKFGDVVVVSTSSESVMRGADRDHIGGKVGVENKIVRIGIDREEGCKPGVGQSSSTLSIRGSSFKKPEESELKSNVLTVLFSGIFIIIISRPSSPPPPLRMSTITFVFRSVPLAWKDRNLRLHGIEMLDYGSERDMICQLFREVRRDIAVHFDFATTDKLRTAVTMGCRALHFSGHGHPNCLNFEDGRSGLQLVTVETLRDLCIAGSKLDFVFVSACHSKRAGEAFAQAGVKHVVCVKVDARLLDAAANVFTRAFYVSLAVGNTVKQAFDIGRNAVRASPYIPDSAKEGEKFLLLPDDANHDEPVFVCDVVPQWPVPIQGNRSLSSFTFTGDSTYLPHLSLPQPPEDFEGREVDMHRLITMVLSRRLVSLVGTGGAKLSTYSVLTK